MTRVLVTGGAGRLGQLVVEELTERGHSVMSLDRVPWNGPVRPGVTEVVADLLDPDVAQQYAQGIDVVAHLAAELLPTPSCLRTNQQTTWNVLMAAVDCGVRRVVYASSVYAFGHHWGFTADQYPDGYQRYEIDEIMSVAMFPIDEESQPAPQDPYSASKLLNEQSAHAVSISHGLCTVGLRFGDIWFEALQTWWQRPPTPHRPAKGEKFDFWNYVDGGDATRAVAEAIEREGLPLATVMFIIADDTQVREGTREALAASFPELLKRIPPDMGSRASLFSNRRAREILGWAPMVSWKGFEPQ